jgi:hypothetical protein
MSQQSDAPRWEVYLATPSTVGLVSAVLLGGVEGAAITLVGQGDLTQETAVWAAVGTALTASAGLSAANGRASWQGLRESGSATTSRAMISVISLVALAVLLVLAGYLMPTGQPSTRGVLLLGVAILGGIPALMAIGAIHTRVSTIDRGDGVDAFDDLGVLRVVLVRQLRGLGALVALATLALAISPGLGSMFPEAESGSGVVLVLGGAGSAIVAMAYVPVATVLRTKAAGLSRYLFPLGTDDDGHAVLDRLRDRQDLLKLVMGDRGIYDELMASLVVATPLMTAAIGRLVAA